MSKRVDFSGRAEFLRESQFQYAVPVAYLTEPGLSTSFIERVYITAPGCEFGSGTQGFRIAECLQN